MQALRSQRLLRYGLTLLFGLVLGGAAPASGSALLAQALEALLVALLLVPLLALLLVIPATLLGVFLVLDGGCLRYLLFGLGWICAALYGLIVGGLVVGGLLGLDALVGSVLHVFLWGYPIVAWWGQKKLEAMPRDEYQAWDQTLTGGALLGFGAGSVTSLLRSVVALKSGGGVGGFGGGSFGGGGASGSWSGAAAPVSGAAQMNPVISSNRDPEVASDSSSAERPAQSAGRWTRLSRWIRKFQWYHGVAFVLATLVFVPIGLGTVHALQDLRVLVFVLGATLVYGALRLIRRNSVSHPSVVDPGSSFRGGTGSSSWS